MNKQDNFRINDYHRIKEICFPPSKIISYMNKKHIINI